MTGATVVIRRGTDFIMCKVRHDGMDVLDFFDRKNFFDLFPVYREPIKEYLRARYDPSNPFVADEIQTDFKEGFSCQLVGDFEVYDYTSFENLLDRIVEKLHEISPEDNLDCSYVDYCILVDYNLGEVFDARKEEVLVKRISPTPIPAFEPVFTAFL